MPNPNFTDESKREFISTISKKIGRLSEVADYLKEENYDLAMIHFALHSLQDSSENKLLIKNLKHDNPDLAESMHTSKP